MLPRLWLPSPADAGAAGAVGAARHRRNLQRLLDMQATHARLHDRTVLARKMPFARDADIRFFDGPHVYFVRNEGAARADFAAATYETIGQFAAQVPVSVTGLVHAPFVSFDAASILRKKTAEQKLAAYGSADDRAIARAWKQSNGEKAALGTRMHAAIELYFNTGYVSRDPAIQIEMAQMLRFSAWLSAQGIDVVRTEPTIWIRTRSGALLAGSVDCLARHRVTREWYVLDWKRTGSALDHAAEHRYGTGVVPPFDRIKDRSVDQYSIQLCMYGRMMREYYVDNKPIIVPPENLLIVRFHADADDYQITRAAPYASLADELVDNHPCYLKLYYEHKAHEETEQAWMGQT